MTITIAPEIEEQLRQRAFAQGLSIEAYVEWLIREDELWREEIEEPSAESGPQFEEILQAVVEGLEEVERGEGRPATEVFTELRSKNGLSR